MLHLPTERLAALADDEPTALEAEHLAACAECTRERAAHAALVRLALDERARIEPPLTEWPALAAHLRAEKVIASRPARRALPLRALWRAAAALLLMAGGVAVGRVSAGEPPLPWRSASPSPVAGGGTEDVSAMFASRVEAEEALQRAEASYQRALEYLVELDASTLPQRDDADRVRLAALDQIARTTARALDEVPYDPVLNSYYLSTLSAREVTLRQLGAALPEGVRLTSY
jgi:hypothetical protein